MERVKALLQSPAYQDHVHKINERESLRPFCKHDFDHFLEVARLSWIFLLQEGEEYPRDVVYAAAFLHDIGRWREYKGEGCHAHLSAEIAAPLLTSAGYSLQEKKLIVDAVREHRQDDNDIFSSPLGKALRRADKYSRLCFQCSKKVQCRKVNTMPQNHQLYF